MHDRRDRIEERQRVLVGEFADGVGEGSKVQRPGSANDVLPNPWRQAVDSAR